MQDDPDWLDRIITEVITSEAPLQQKEPELKPAVIVGPHSYRAVRHAPNTRFIVERKKPRRALPRGSNGMEAPTCQDIPVTKRVL